MLATYLYGNTLMLGKNVPNTGLNSLMLRSISMFKVHLIMPGQCNVLQSYLSIFGIINFTTSLWRNTYDKGGADSTIL